MPRARLRGLTSLFLVVGLGCQRDAGVPTVHRFVDPALRGGAVVEPDWLIGAASRHGHPDDTAGLPTATIDNDTRLVLAAHPEGRISQALEERTLADGRPAFEVALGDVLPTATHVLLHPEMSVDPGVVPLLPLLAPIEQVDGQRLISVNSLRRILTSFRNQRVGLQLYRACPKRTSYRTPAVVIPPEATLDFAVGILDAARGQGPVRASVEACDGARCDMIHDEVLEPIPQRSLGWQDRHVSLRDHAGERRAFVFETAPVVPNANEYSLPVWANPTIRSSELRAPGPSVILVSIDTLRRDHLSVYAYERDTSPFLAQLAKRGVVFEQAIAEATTTGPSHMTMLTGLPASVHGVNSWLVGLSVPARTVADVARAHLFDTAAFTEGGPLSHVFGFNQGFAEYVENADPFGGAAGDVAGTFAKARAWLAHEKDRPFFLFLHTFQVHAPYKPTGKYLEYFADGPSPAAIPVKGAKAALAYDREIRFVDDELAALVRWLEQEGFFSHTVLIVTSDHGEAFFEHGEIGHNTLPYDEVLRVPLVVFGAGVAPNRRVATPVSHGDYMATILELMSLPTPGVPGRSFAAHIRDDAVTRDDSERSIVSAGWDLPLSAQRPAYAIRRGGKKLLRFRTADGVAHAPLFDLDADPGETRPVESDAAGASLDVELEAFLRSADELRSRLAADAPAAPKLVDDDAVEQQLRALGYVE